MTAALLFCCCIGIAVVSSISVPAQQVHIAFANDNGDTNSIAVSWLTMPPTPTDYTPVVLFGTTQGTYEYTAKGVTAHYYKSFHHDTVLSALKPDTQYFYKCGDPKYGLSAEFNFTSPAPFDGPYKVAVYGDMGVTNSENTRARLSQLAEEVDFFYHVGDMSYADDRLTTTEYEDVYNEWAAEVESLAAHKPYMVCPGNHEATCHSATTLFCPPQLSNFTAYNHRFRMPGKGNPAIGHNMWYSFDYKNVHFVSISTETDFPGAAEGPFTLWHSGPFGDQLSWLKADLAAANTPEARALRPWVIVIGHRPMYSSSRRGFQMLERSFLIAAMEDMFHTHAVDMFFVGHVHAYERQYPVYKDKVCAAQSLSRSRYVRPTCPTSLVVGCAGNIEGHEDNWKVPRPDWNVEQYSADYGYGVLQVFNRTTIGWQFFSSSDNKLQDEFVLEK